MAPEILIVNAWLKMAKINEQLYTNPEIYTIGF